MMAHHRPFGTYGISSPSESKNFVKLSELFKPQKVVSQEATLMSDFDGGGHRHSYVPDSRPETQDPNRTFLRARIGGQKRPETHGGMRSTLQGRSRIQGLNIQTTGDQKRQSTQYRTKTTEEGSLEAYKPRYIAEANA